MLRGILCKTPSWGTIVDTRVEARSINASFLVRSSMGEIFYHEKSVCDSGNGGRARSCELRMSALRCYRDLDGFAQFTRWRNHCYRRDIKKKKSVRTTKASARRFFGRNTPRNILWLVLVATVTIPEVYNKFLIKIAIANARLRRIHLHVAYESTRERGWMLKNLRNRRISW